MRTLSRILMCIMIIGSSYTFVNASEERQTEERLTNELINEIIDSVISGFNNYYIFPEMAVKIEKHVRDQLKNGKYDDANTIETLLDLLYDDLLSVTNDHHIAFAAMTQDEIRRAKEDVLNEEETDDQFDPEKSAEESYQNFYFVKVERLSGNIGYLRFDRFAELEEVEDVIAQAMGFLSRTDEIIIDLRYNCGGDVQTYLALGSYFFDKPFCLGGWYNRITDSVTEFWTRGNVKGEKCSDKKLYILTSGETFSAAESFAYNMKHAGRATIVGEKTTGGAHAVQFF